MDTALQPSPNEALTTFTSASDWHWWVAPGFWVILDRCTLCCEGLGPVIPTMRQLYLPEVLASHIVNYLQTWGYRGKNTCQSPAGCLALAARGTHGLQHSREMSQVGRWSGLAVRGRGDLPAKRTIIHLRMQIFCHCRLTHRGSSTIITL